MSKYQQMSAKDRAFEREKTKLRATIQQKNDEIHRLNQEIVKYKAEAESWEKAAKNREDYIGIPKEKILADIERSQMLVNFLKPFM